MTDTQIGSAKKAHTLFECADRQGLRIPSSCSRMGRCHECIVEVTSGYENLSEPSDTESFLAKPYRLACQASVQGSCEDAQFQALWQETKVLRSEEALDPSWEMYPPVRLREDDVLYYGERIGRRRNALLGVSVDLGTTTIAIELVELTTGVVQASCGIDNPQSFGGSDVMNRISYDGEPNNVGELQKAAVSAINREVRNLTGAIGCTPVDVHELVVVGNTTMRDLFFGLDVQPIGQRPYRSVTEEGRRERGTSTSLDFRARDLGVRINRQAHAYGPPILSGHLGSDVVCALAAVRMMGFDPSVGPEPGTSMFVDVGTNTEIVIRHKGVLYAASTPAGPAFEGGEISCGMRAFNGAIESLQLGDDGIPSEFLVIGDETPKGFCGSGLIDLLAELRSAGIIDEQGVLFQDSKIREFDLKGGIDLSVSRNDMSLLCQAKAANYSGQYLLMQEAGIGPSDIDTFYLSGAFANYVDPCNAVSIGFLPPVAPERIRKVGNAASLGARMLLLSDKLRNRVELQQGDVKHLELEMCEGFFDAFVEGCQIKPMPMVIT